MTISWTRQLAVRRFGAASGLALLALAGADAVSSAQTLPTDPQQSCTVPAATFATWFQSGAPSLNGVVVPANSVTFSAAPNCSFYQWSMQMFLWLTSPAPPVYGFGGFIFDSPAFYDVSPPDPSTGQRTLIPHTRGFIHPLALRASKPGPAGARVIIDKAGQMFEVAPSQRAAVAAPQVVDTEGKSRTVGHVGFNEQGARVLRDPQGAVIATRPLQQPPSNPALRRAGPLPQVQRIIVDNIPIFIGSGGNVIDVEQGEAGAGDVLMSQNNSLVYYATMVNDVYAYFLTGWRDGQIQAGVQNPLFPTSMTDLNAITNFATAHGKTFPDPEALAVEIKTAWVEASTLANVNNYITMTATIPTYDQTSSNTTWTPNGQKTVKLALVGMHVVGSTNQHPEMVWATFEHAGNTPLATFSYINKLGMQIQVNEAPGGTWLFSSVGNPNPFNQPHMATGSGGSIQAISPFTISKSDTLRMKPFGAASDISPNPLDSTPAASNSEIISINNSVASMMPPGDVRNNYILSGATWSIPGIPPGASGTGVQVGTSQLTNSTLETYDQGPATTQGGANCLDCHSSTNQDGSNNPSAFVAGVSHIFFAIQKLF